MKQNLLSVGMIIAMLLSFLPASAYDFEVDGIYYEIISVSDLTCMVTNGEISYQGTITIPSHVTYNNKELRVVEIGASAFSSTDVEHVNINEGVKKIRSNAFNGCVNLKSINIPSSIDELENYSFSGCTSLNDLLIEDGDNALKIGYNGTHSARYYNMPTYVTEYVEYYPSGDYYNHRAWTEGLFIESPLENLYIGRNFSYVTRDGEQIYKDRKGTRYAAPVCSPFSHHNYTNVTIGPKVNELYGMTFRRSTIQNVILKNADNPIKIYVNRRIDYDSYLDEDEYLFRNTQLRSAQVDRDYEFNKERSYGLFSDIKTLECVSIGDNLTKIASYEFKNCIRLHNLHLGSSLHTIGSYAFYSNLSLSTLSLPQSLEYIEEGAFMKSSITHCDFSTKLKSIGGYGFAQTYLREINLPTFLNNIGRSAFAGCEILRSAKINGNITSLDQSIFQNCSNLEVVSLPSSLKTIGENCFNGCKGLQQISIPDYVELIEDNAFYGCLSLKIVDIGRSLKKIGSGVFSQSDLTTINIFASTPPTVRNETAFSVNTYLHGVCKTPQGKAEEYLDADIWKNFWDIQDNAEISFILHQPTSDELYVTLNTDDDSNCFQWYKMSECEGSNDIFTSELVILKDSGQWYMNYPWKYDDDSWYWSYPNFPGASIGEAILGRIFDVSSSSEISFDYSMLGRSTSIKIYWNDVLIDELKYTSESMGNGHYSHIFNEDSHGMLKIVAYITQGLEYRLNNLRIFTPEHLEEREIEAETKYSLDNNCLVSGDNVRCKILYSNGRELWSNNVIISRNNDVPVQFLYFDKISALLSNINKVNIQAKCLPQNATKQELEWYSSDEEIATVDNQGNVTPISCGKVIISAKTTDGTNISAACTLNIVDDNLGIESVGYINENGPYAVYNLQGTQITSIDNISQLNDLSTGIYIVNGKKVFIK